MKKQAKKTTSPKQTDKAIVSKQGAKKLKLKPVSKVKYKKAWLFEEE